MTTNPCCQPGDDSMQKTTFAGETHSLDCPRAFRRACTVCGLDRFANDLVHTLERPLCKPCYEQSIWWAAKMAHAAAGKAP